MQEVLRTMSNTRYEQNREPMENNPRANARVSKFPIYAYLVCFVLLIAMVFSYVQLNEISDISVKLQKELEDLQEQNQLLTIQINQRLGHDQIKQQAQERFGMVKLSKDQVTYINSQNTDTVEIISQSELLRDRSQIIAGLARGLRWLVEYIN